MLGTLDLLKIVLASGVVAAAVGWAKDVYFTRKQNALDARFAAIEIVAKLELFALRAQRNVENYWELVRQLEPQCDYHRWPHCSYPELDIEKQLLKLMDLETSSSIAWLETEKALAAQHLYHIHEDSIDPTDSSDHGAYVVAYFGHEALLMAQKLRKKHGLSSFGQRWRVTEEIPVLKRGWDETIKQINKHKPA